jgi:hypothetical protein
MEFWKVTKKILKLNLQKNKNIKFAGNGEIQEHGSQRDRAGGVFGIRVQHHTRAGRTYGLDSFRSANRHSLVAHSTGPLKPPPHNLVSMLPPVILLRNIVVS